MARSHWFVGVGAGLAAGLVTTIALTGGRAVPKAVAQGSPAGNTTLVAPEPVPPPPPPAAPRYQIVTWSQPAGVRDTGALIAPSHGAYVLDTHGGEVWLVEETRRPSKIERIGKVGAE